ncbi:hypothetical protein L6V77_24160 [Myxococcota bacterium]|nr:hypothetical protein [Myxococcota bacterium]
MDDVDQRIAELEKRLSEAASEVPDIAEMLRGTVGERYVRCGKPGCHCEEGAGHGPVFFVSSSVGGRTKQVALTPETYEVAKRYVGNYARLREIVDEVSMINQELLQARRAKQRAEQSAGGE